MKQISRTRNTSPKPETEHQNQIKHHQIKPEKIAQTSCKKDFSIEIKQGYKHPWRSPSSLLHLIRNKIYSCHINLNLGIIYESWRSDKESHPSRVLFIAPSKILKD
jgi:hypothetical protein